VGRHTTASHQIAAPLAAESVADAGALRLRLALRGVGLFVVCASIALSIQWNRIIPLNAAWGWGGDEGQMLWNLWVVHQGALHGHNPLITDQVFFPAATNLTHHSLGSGYLPVTVLADLFSGHDPLYPFIALRLGTWLCSTLCLLFTYLVLRYLGYTLLEAAIPGVGYAFSSFNGHHLHLTLLSGWFVPLDALMALRWWRAPTPARATAAAFCFGIGVYFSEFSLFCAVALGFACIVVCCRREGRQALRQRLRATGLPGAIVACVVAVAVAAPFLVTFAKADPVVLPDIQEHRDMSSDLFGPLIPTYMSRQGPATLLYGHLFERFDARVRTGYESFLGFPLLLLAAIGMLRRRQNPAVVNGAAILALIFYILTLGPTLHVRGHDTVMYMPYMLFINLPPFNIQRGPVRLVVFLGFFMAIVAAHGAARLRQGIAGASAQCSGSSGQHQWRNRAGAAVLAATLVWAYAESFNPHPAFATYLPPAAIARLKTGDEKSRTPLACLPIFDTDGYSEMLEIFHHRPILAGYLARLTPKQKEICFAFKNAYSRGPQQYSRYIKACGADTVIVADGAPNSFYTPPCSFLADLAGRVELVDVRSVKPKFVGEFGDHHLTNGEPSDAPGTFEVEGGKDLPLSCPAGADRLELLASSNAQYDLALLSHGQPVIGLTALPTLIAPQGGLQWRCLYFPPTVFDTIRIVPHERNSISTVGRLTAWASPTVTIKPE